MGKNNKKFRMKKKYGQNFLIDQGILDQIIDVAEIDEKDIILEIGPGSGKLTKELAKRAKKVIGVEIDEELIPILDKNLKEFSNIEIINQDILKLDFKEVLEGRTNQKTTPSKQEESSLGKDQGKKKIVANLPYYISKPIIMKILESDIDFDRIVIMLQREVATRLLAQPGGKEYGVLSLMTQFYAQVEVVCQVGPESFNPRPKVSSTVVSLKKIQPPLGDPRLKKKLFLIIKAAFMHRRKTLVNSLMTSGFLPYKKEDIIEGLASIGYDEKTRGERLSLKNYIDLSYYLESKEKVNKNLNC